MLKLAVAALVVAGAWQVAAAGWIHAKALLAQRLIASAWEQVRDGGVARRPWPWADMRPIARLTVPGRGLVLHVLDNAGGRSLAFGPGHVSGTAAPAGGGNTVLVAHRDTHFAFLRELRPGEEIAVEAGGGRSARYRVSEVRVVDRSDARVMDEADAPRLTLITCFPFDAVAPGTRLRYVVIAERIA